MSFYKEEKGKLICLLCDHYCCLQEKQVGLCGVNKNTGEKIECLVYGHVAALNVDPIEKKPLYHFLPGSQSLSLGTVGCNFKCAFCQNWGISQEHEINKEQYFEPAYLVDLALSHNCASLSYTYNEPTIFYPFAKALALKAKERGLKSVFVSNGFQSSEVVEDMKGVIDAVNIDLKTFNEKYYKKLGGKLQTVLRNLKRFKALGIWVEITTLIVPTKNDTPEELRQIASFIKEELGANVPWHLSSFHPDFKENKLPKTSFKQLQMAYDIAQDVGLQYVYIGNVAFENETKCTKCGALLIRRENMSVVKNNLVQGACPKCSKVLEGVYDEK